MILVYTHYQSEPIRTRVSRRRLLDRLADLEKFTRLSRDKPLNMLLEDPQGPSVYTEHELQIVDRENGKCYQQIATFLIGGCCNSLQWLSVLCVRAAATLLPIWESTLMWLFGIVNDNKTAAVR